jgi:NitT/TauT family transport system ATP-binding protein
MGIDIENLEKAFGDLNVLDSISMSLPSRGISVILGPSGCGKTTLLHILSGTTKADKGILRGLEGMKISYIFQEPRLIPWMTVWDNCSFVLPADMGKGERKDRISHVLEVVGLRDFTEYYPRQLSGGMRQRTAMARAFAYPSDVLLMDEPFQALDIRLKLKLLEAFNHIWKEMKRTTVFVTHNIQEALLLGDNVFLFSPLPARVKKHFLNDVPREERRLGDERLFPLEQALYEIITE